MAQVTKTVDRTTVNGNEVFVYTLNVSYSGLTQPAQNGFLLDFFPSEILYTLPQIGGVLQSITETPVVGGTNVSFNFGQVTSGTSISFTMACSFSAGRKDGDTFTNKADLYADGVIVATSTAPTVTLHLTADFRLFKTSDDSNVVNAGDEKIITLSLFNNGDFGAEIQNVVITDILPPQLIPISVPVGNSIPVLGYDDPTYNGLLGAFVGNVMTFTLPSFSGALYQITFKVKIADTVTPGENIINTANWTIGGVAQTSSSHLFVVFSEATAFGITKTGTRTGMIGSPIAYSIFNINNDNISYANYVLDDAIPPEVNITEFKFASSFPTYDVSISLSSSPATFIPVIVGASNNTPLTDLTPFIPLGEKVAHIKVTAPTITFGVASIHTLSLFGNVNSTAVTGQTVINAATASADGVTVTVTFGTSIDGRSDLSIQKNIIPVQPAYFPLENFKFVLTAGAPNTITVNPVIGDLIPIGVQYVLDSEYFNYFDPITGITYDSRNPGFPVPLPTRDIIANFAGTGRKLVRWNFNFVMPINASLQVFFTAFVEINPPSSFQNIAFEGNPGDNVLFVYDSITDTLDYDGDGITNELISSVTVDGVMLTTTEFLLQKQVKGQKDLEFSSAGLTVSGGDVSYKLLVTNNQPIDLKDIEIVDIFPYVGDTGVILVDQPRLSQFQVYPTSVVTAEIVNVLGDPVLPVPIIVIEYSTSNDPMRFDELGNPIGTGTWSLVPPLDITTLRSIKVTTDPTVILKPYEQLVININAKAPVGTPVGLTAFNSFAVRANKIIDGVVSPLLPTEPNKVSVTIVTEPLGSIGQFVWLDSNGDGIFQPGEVGVNGVTVILYDANMNQIATTVTSNNFANEAGFYSFNGLAAGNYFVEFVPYGSFSLTIQKAIEPNGSRPNQTTGLTNVIALGQGQNIVDVNAGLLTSCTPPVINANNRCTQKGLPFDPMLGVSAFDCGGNDITSSVIITQNTVNIDVAGNYLVTYSVTDSIGQTTLKTITVVVCSASVRQQVITDLIQSIALQEAALAHIMNAEGEKIQNAVSMSLTSDEMLEINSSVIEMTQAITGLESVLQQKLSLFDCDLCRSGCCDNILL